MKINKIYYQFFSNLFWTPEELLCGSYEIASILLLRPQSYRITGHRNLLVLCMKISHDRSKLAKNKHFSQFLRTHPTVLVIQS